MRPYLNVVSLLLVNGLVIYFGHAQDVSNGASDISNSINRFALRLLAQTNRESGDNLNVALSPFTVWTLLTIISEGARGNTLRELETALGIPTQSRVAFQYGYKQLARTLEKTNSPSVNLEITNAIFATNEFPLNPTFQNTAKTVYGVDVIPVDFKDPRPTLGKINKYISQATKNKIPEFLNSNDLEDATIFMTSALFFKGQWKSRFNKTQTHLETFFDEIGNKRGTVEMMYQQGTFPYTLLTKFNCFAVQLPYGQDEKASMIVLLPRKGEKLSTVLDLLVRNSFSEVVETLERAALDFAEEEVELYLPKFRVGSEFNLNVVLQQMGIRDAFDLNKSDLLGIYPQYLYVSRLLQKAVIDVDEEGTVAAAVASAEFAYKMTSPKMVINKPFIYLIVDKATKSLLFAGKVSNPESLCDKCTGNQ